MSTRISTATKAARSVKRAKVNHIAKQIQALNREWVAFRVAPETYVPQHAKLVEALRRAEAEVY